MRESKNFKMLMIILISLIVVTMGVSFAYFYAVITGTGNESNNQSSVSGIPLGTVNYDGQLTFDGTGIYPGYYGIQTFTISPGSQNGMGRYEIDLESTIATEFGTNVEITLYKTTDPTNNYVTRNIGVLTQNGNQFSQVDTLTVTGTLDTVYETKALVTSTKTVLEQANNFTIPGFNTITYYLVYHYKNQGNQYTQKGKAFSGKVTVNSISPLIYNYGDTAVSFMKKLDNQEATNLVYDGTSDNNLRYFGVNPNNYLSFNGELWRIIGVMNNIDNGSGTKESRLKIIRNESIGNYSWDSSASTVNNGYGVNEWSQADLMTELNSGPYWNRTSGTCYFNSNNVTIACDFSSTGLTSASQAMIGNALWNTGSQGTNDYTQTTVGLTSNFYTYERSSDTGKICTSGTECNDTVSRTTTWIGKVALMYPSDYGYATAGGNTTNRASCLATGLDSWRISMSDCRKNDWLNNNAGQWLLTPSTHSSSSARIFYIDSAGAFGMASAYLMAFPVRPVSYLISTIKITGGIGTSTDPYILSL